MEAAAANCGCVDLRSPFAGCCGLSSSSVGKVKDKNSGVVSQCVSIRPLEIKFQQVGEGLKSLIYVHGWGSESHSVK
jgi:hypothetical protein